MIYFRLLLPKKFWHFYGDHALPIKSEGKYTWHALTLNGVKMWPSWKVYDKGDFECQWVESWAQIGRKSYEEPNKTFIFLFLGNSLIHGPLIEDG